MDPLIVFDCENTVPNRFALAVAAVRRARALSRGAEPRLSDKVTVAVELACVRSPATGSSPTSQALRSGGFGSARSPGSARPTKKASRWRRAIPGRRTRLRSEGGALTMSGKEDEQWRNG
ncbi:DNA-directed RNA polymerase subunit omega [Mesorhizobium sp. M1088]|uniref:DNA-directed RNA polymerase subunit omega n=1 Tax=unclassified Mesorhizobium TaxID=325217 RepID=UPI003337CB0E